MSVKATDRPTVSRGRLVAGAAIAVVVAVLASWVVRPAALAQGSMQGFPGSTQATDAQFRQFRVSRLYQQRAAGEVTYKLKVLNDSPWVLTITGASVAAGAAEEVFAAARVALPRRLDVAPGEEQLLVVHATFSPCRSAAATNPDDFTPMPGVRVAFRQFGVPRSQIIEIRDGYAGIRTC